MKWSSFKYLVKQGWHSMVANRLMTLASIGVLVACLMITGVAALLSVNVANTPRNLSVADNRSKVRSSTANIPKKAINFFVKRFMPSS